MTRPKLQLQKWRGVRPYGQNNLVIFLQNASYTIYHYFPIYLFPHTNLYTLVSSVWCFSSYIMYSHNPSFHSHQFPPSSSCWAKLIGSSLQLFTNTVFLWQSLSLPHSLYPFYPHTERFTKQPFIVTLISPPLSLLFKPLQSTPPPYWFSGLLDPCLLLISHFLPASMPNFFAHRFPSTQPSLQVLSISGMRPSLSFLIPSHSPPFCSSNFQFLLQSVFRAFSPVAKSQEKSLLLLTSIFASSALCSL